MLRCNSKEMRFFQILAVCILESIVFSAEPVSSSTVSILLGTTERYDAWGRIPPGRLTASGIPVMLQILGDDPLLCPAMSSNDDPALYSSTDNNTSIALIMSARAEDCDFVDRIRLANRFEHHGVSTVIMAADELQLVEIRGMSFTTNLTVVLVTDDTAASLISAVRESSSASQGGPDAALYFMTQPSLPSHLETASSPTTYSIDPRNSNPTRSSLRRTRSNLPPHLEHASPSPIDPISPKNSNPNDNTAASIHRNTAELDAVTGVSIFAILAWFLFCFVVLFSGDKGCQVLAHPPPAQNEVQVTTSVPTRTLPSQFSSTGNYTPSARYMAHDRPSAPQAPPTTVRTPDTKLNMDDVNLLVEAYLDRQDEAPELSLRPCAICIESCRDVPDPKAASAPQIEAPAEEATSFEVGPSADLFSMTLPCRHRFHVDCIVPWLTENKPRCPLCNDDVGEHVVTARRASELSLYR